jgi:Tol biopolymer transport system component
MTEFRSILERTGAKAPRLDLDLEHILRRRDRRRRNERLMAGVVGFGIFVAAVVVLGSEWQVERLPAGAIPTSTPSIPIIVPLPEPTYVRLDLNGNATSPIPDAIDGAWHYDVSPDGMRVAFMRDALIPSDRCCDPPVGIYVADLDGTAMRQVSPRGIDAFSPRWSPDGTRLVYEGRDAVTSEHDLFIVEVATGRVTRITHLEQIESEGWSLSPAFSPDGTGVLFQLPRRDGNKWDLWNVPVTGGEPVLVRHDAASGEYSPDGQSLGYVRGDALWVVGVDGRDARMLADGAGPAGLRWSPDGTKIAYATGLSIAVIDVATGESRQIAHGPPVVDWIDDTTLIVSSQ